MWSPDGKVLAYHSHRSPSPVTSYRAPGSTDGIWILDSESGLEQMLVNPGIETCMCDWSPHGRKMVFTTIAEGDDKHAPWIFEYSNQKDQKGTISRVPTGELDGDVLVAIWSPLGNEIAFEEDLGGFKRVIWVVNLDNKTKRRIVEYTCFARWGGLDFSNDGKHIYYSALTEGHHQIFKISLNSKHKVQITNHDREVIYPQVSPDGNYIACSVYEHRKEIWSAILK
ncbi:MAG: TolB family protein [Candidatus Heimdallarchaeota archaeon]